ncbi:MAG: hypothetical protein EXR69_13450 [Myxococcales bacterium]|nr:hypothetical protein [Myxococcales bacterium]
MSPRSLICAAPLLLLAACTGPGPSEAGCDATVESGAIEATVDGEDWEGGAATWLLAGSGLQFNSVSDGGWWLSAVAQETTTGATLADVLAAGDWPAQVDLPPEGGAGGWATFYPESGDSFSTKRSTGGRLTVSAAADGTDLLGCFDFTAANERGAEVTVEAGQLRATAG